MNVHKNARLTPRGRERIVPQVESGQTPQRQGMGPPRSDRRGRRYPHGRRDGRFLRQRWVAGAQRRLWPCFKQATQGVFSSGRSWRER
jgi:hypothetical protein